ncbi:MAG: hypothetical protein GY832_37595 [Chloroflexi bacterium]|nr:hypothetical protein [Chloroflexota bacterium]
MSADQWTTRSSSVRRSTSPAVESAAGPFASPGETREEGEEEDVVEGVGTVGAVVLQP